MENHSLLRYIIQHLSSIYPLFYHRISRKRKNGHKSSFHASNEINSKNQKIHERFTLPRSNSGATYGGLPHHVDKSKFDCWKLLNPKSERKINKRKKNKRKHLTDDQINKNKTNGCEKNKIFENKIKIKNSQEKIILSVRNI